MYIIRLFFLCRFDPIPGHGLPSEGSRSHSLDTRHAVGLPWTSDQPDTERNYTHQRQTSMPSAGFEPTILAASHRKPKP